MATHSSILAWEIPWTEEAGRLQSLGSQRVGHNLAIKTTKTTSRNKGLPDDSAGKESACNAGDTGNIDSILGQKIPWRREWQPTPAFLPIESYGQRSLVG